MARPSSADRARRLIALLGRLQPDSDIPLSVLADELGVSEQVLADDLSTLSLCGIAPYDPLGLVPVLVEDGVVRVFGEIPAVDHAIRLTRAEAGALAAALQAAGYSPGDELPARLLTAAAERPDASELRNTVLTAIGSHQPEIYQALASAIADSRVAEIEHAGGSETALCRVVEPRALFAERSLWYLTAWCRTAEDWRTFRLDRIHSVNVLTERADSTREGVPAPRALDESVLPVARLRFADTEQFVEREWPGGRMAGRDEDGRVLADVPYAGTDWIARRVLARFGAVEVLSPREVRAAVRELGTRELDLL